ncbi:MAG: hypothetical protein V1728_01220 [Candidatus Micrarchaeota archaeon]
MALVSYDYPKELESALAASHGKFAAMGDRMEGAMTWLFLPTIVAFVAYFVGFFLKYLLLVTANGSGPIGILLFIFLTIMSIGMGWAFGYIIFFQRVNAPIRRVEITPERVRFCQHLPSLWLEFKKNKIVSFKKVGAGSLPVSVRPVVKRYNLSSYKFYGLVSHRNNELEHVFWLFWPASRESELEAILGKYPEPDKDLEEMLG